MQSILRLHAFKDLLCKIVAEGRLFYLLPIITLGSHTKPQKSFYYLLLHP